MVNWKGCKECCPLNSMVFKRKSPLIVLLVPAFLFMLVFLIYPFIVNIYNSFFTITQLGATPGKFNHFVDYKTIVKDPLVRVSLINTFKMMALTVVFQVGLALMLALMVDSIRKGAQFFRVVYFFPIVISATALGLLFNLMVLYLDGSSGGMFNQILIVLGQKSIDFKSEKNAFLTMAIPVVWQYVGFYFVIILAGISNIPQDVYESAMIDGATGFQKIRYITLPLLYNVLTTCLILAITGALKIFDLPWTMFQGGVPYGKTYLLGTYMYQQTFNAGNVDFGSTLALLMVVLGVLLSQIVNTVFKPKEY